MSAGTAFAGTAAPRRPAAGPAGLRPSGPAGTRPGGRSDAARPSLRQRLEAMAAGYTALFLEVEAGRRPRGQLARLMTPMLYARLSDVWVRPGTPGTLVRVHVAEVTGDRCDAVAIVRRAHRCGAISLRLVRTRRGWLVEDLAMPERGPLPLPPYPVPLDDSDDGDDLLVVPSPARAGAPSTPAPDWSPAGGGG